MDMQMPVMDGLEATRKIRQLPEGKDIPILAMTANAFVEDKRNCFESGMNDFIDKPVLPEKLFDTLLKWLSRRPWSWLHLGAVCSPIYPENKLDYLFRNRTLFINPF